MRKIPAVACSFLVSLLLCEALLAQVPTTINYQGRLLRNNPGQAAVMGTADIVFSIWTDSTGGTQVWTETWTGVELRSGVFSVLLGSNGSPLTPDLFQADTTLYLQLEVDGEVLTPRQMLGSSPFAMVDDPENELQDLSLTGDTLSLSQSAATVDLSAYRDDTDQQDLSLSGSTLSLSNDATPVDLSGFLDNTDAQTLSLTDDTLTISGSGSSVDLASSETIRILEQRVTSIGDMVMRRVFVSSTTFSGNLGGLNGADAQCQALADAASLGGTFLAWLSSTAESPLTRFDRFGSFFLVNGTQVADSWEDLTDGSLDAGIQLNENGADVSGQEVWTATDTSGSLAGSNHCGNWSSTTGSGVTGLSGQTGAAWTDDGLGDCATPRHLYCFEQSSFVNTDDQELSLAGNALRLTSDDGTDSVDLSTYLDNTDNQTLSLTGTTLTISGSNSSVELSSFTNTDEQDLSLSGTTLSLTNDPTPVNLSAFLDNTDEQDLALSGNTLSLSGDPTPVSLVPYLDNTDAQTLGLSGSSLSISGSGSTVSLASFLDDTDDQTLSLSGTNLSIAGGNSVSLAGFLDNTDSQNLNNVLAQGNDANDRDITNVDLIDVDELTCDECIDTEEIARDTIGGNDIQDNIFILHIDCNGGCANMSMRDACDVIENLRGLTVEVELIGVSCIHGIPSTTGNGFVPCDDGSEVFSDYECRAFNLRTLGDLPCIGGDGTDVIVTCLQTDIAK